MKGHKERKVPMTPHRRRVLEVLSSGPIEDDKGWAVRKLMEQTGHQTTNALSGVLESMEEAGLIRREIAGRRTYRIEAAAELDEPEAPPAPVVPIRLPEPEPERSVEETLAAGDVDLDLLAGLVLKKAMLAMRNAEDSRPAKEAEERAKREAARADHWKAEAEKAQARAAELEAMVSTLEHNVSILSAQLDKPSQRKGYTARELMDKESRELLDGLMRALPSRR